MEVSTISATAILEVTKTQIDGLSEAASTNCAVLAELLQPSGLDEEVFISDFFECAISKSVSDGLGIFDISAYFWPQSVDDSLDMEDSHEIGWLKLILDSIAATDLSDWALSFTVEEIILLYDELKHGWAVTNEESLALTDSLSEVLGLIISDWIALIDTQSNNWNGREIVPDTLNLYDLAQMGKIISDSISDTFDVADVSTMALTVTVLEYLGFAELANAVRTGGESVGDSLALDDAPSSALSLLIQEALSVVDVSSVVLRFIEALQESIGLADTASLIKRIGVSVTDPLTFTETLTSHGHLYSVVYDSLHMNVTVEIDGEVYECYVLNTPKFKPSMYSGFNFNSYCVFEGRAFGANDTGIYELTGATDAGNAIHTGVILTETDFGAPNQKRFRQGYLGISGTSPVMVFETEDGARQAYAVDTKGKVVASHELKSKRWKLSIADFDTLDTVKLIPIILTK